MLEKIKNKSQGFTIIEVLIVLAIAGLIILIVLLAVPALQRNSANTARKEDAGRIATAVNDFVSNNQGGLPPQTDTAADVAAGCTIISNDAGNLSQYGPTANTPISCNTSTTPATNSLTIVSGGAAVPASIPANAVFLDEGAQCGTTQGTITTSGVTARQAALLYAIASSGSTSWVWSCLNVE